MEAPLAFMGAPIGLRGAPIGLRGAPIGLRGAPIGLKGISIAFNRYAALPIKIFIRLCRFPNIQMAQDTLHIQLTLARTWGVDATPQDGRFCALYPLFLKLEI